MAATTFRVLPGAYNIRTPSAGASITDPCAITAARPSRQLAAAASSCCSQPSAAYLDLRTSNPARSSALYRPVPSPAAQLLDLLFGEPLMTPSVEDAAEWLSRSGLWDDQASVQPAAFTATTHDDRYELACDLPGMGPDDVSVEVTPEGLLRVWGERKRVLHARAEDGSVARQAVSAHSFERAFYLPEDALADQVVASLDKGVLTVAVPRRAPQPEPQPRRIAVTAGQAAREQGAHTCEEPQPQPQAEHQPTADDGEQA